MVMLVIPPLPEKVFHKIIEILPNPSSVDVRLYGDFDFTPMDKQVQQLLPQVKFESHGEQIYRLRDPDKETILKIYNADHAKIQRGMSIHKVEWWLNGASIELTPLELRVSYQGKEPQIVAELRKVITHPEMIVEMKAGMQAQ